MAHRRAPGAHTRPAAHRRSVSTTRPARDPQGLAADLLGLYAATSLNRFIEHAFCLLPRMVRCDFVSAIYRRAGGGFLNERDSRGRAWGRAFMRRYAELTPAIPLVLANPGVKILSTRDALTAPEDELRQTPFYLEVMRPQGWRHGAVLCFWAEPAQSFPLLVLALYRAEGSPDFSGRERARLAQLHPFMGAAVKRFHQVASSTAVSDGIAAALRHVSHGIVVLDWRLRVVNSNLAGRRSCTAWDEGGMPTVAPSERPGGVKVPAVILEACERLRRDLQSLMRKSPAAVAHRRMEVTSKRFTASVDSVCQPTALAEPSFVVEFAATERASPSPDGTRACLERLTPSEREVALVVADGLSNDEAAEQLGKTTGAVKFLLHRVYTKLAVPNRARLALLVRGRSGA